MPLTHTSAELAVSDTTFNASVFCKTKRTPPSIICNAEPCTIGVSLIKCMSLPPLVI